MARAIEAFEFHRAALGLYDFVYGELCDWYLELVKPRLYADDDAAVSRVALHVLGRDARARASGHPVRHRGDLGPRPRRGGPAGGRAPARRPTGADRRRGGGASSAARSPPCRSCARWRDRVGAAPPAVMPARLAAEGYERTAAHVARLARVELSTRRNGARAGRDGRRPRRRGGRARPPTPSTSARPQRARSTSAAPGSDGEIARAEGKLANEGFVAKAPRGGGRGRARQARRAARGARRRCDARGAPSGPRSHLLGLELFGMRFGLERMRRLLTALGSPQERFAAIHVVGTNGKSSTDADGRGAARGARHARGRLPLAAPDLVRRAHPDRRRATSSPTRSAPPSSAPPRRPRRSTARLERRRPRDAVRAAHRRRVRRAGAPRASRSRSSRRGSAAATTRPNVLRAPVVGAHERRARAHALARADDRATSRARSSRSCAPGATLVLGASADAEVAEALARGDAARGSCAPRTPASSRRCPGFQRHELRAWPARPPRELPRRARRRRGRARRRAGITVPGRLQVVGERAADDPRRRPQPERGRRARRGAARASTRPLGASSRSSTTRTPAAMLRRAAAALRRASSAPPRRTRARCRPRRWPRSPRSSAADGARSSRDPRAALARARELAGPGRRGASRPAPSTSSRTCVVRAGAQEGLVHCERTRPQRPRDDRPRGGRRGARRSWCSSPSATLSGACSSRRDPRVRAVRCLRLPHDTLRRLRHRQRRAQHGGQRPDPRSDRHLGRAGLLDVRRRPPPHRRPDARGLRDARVAVPVRGDDRLHDRPPAGVPRRRAPARARDAGRRGAPAAARLPALPALRVRGQGRLPALPELHAQAQGPLHELRQGRGPVVAAVPVLRGRDGRRHVADQAAERRRRRRAARPRTSRRSSRPLRAATPADRT